MAEKTTEANLFDWRLPLCAALITLAISISLAVCQADIALFLYFFLVGPILIAFSIALLVFTLFGKGRRKRLTLLSTLATVWIVSASLFVYHFHVRTAARWLMWSHNYKDTVLAQKSRANGEFRHVEWDGWGWGGQDTTVFLVFDPTDSLSLSCLNSSTG